MSDPILFWNHTATDANRIDHTGTLRARNQRGPTLSARALAMVNVAMHDAYFGFVPVDETYNPDAIRPVFPENVRSMRSAPDQDDLAVLIATAAHYVLSDLYPSQRDTFDRLLAGVMSGAAGREVARDFGLLVGQNVLKRRDKDGAEKTIEPTFNIAKGHHHSDPLNEPKGVLGGLFGNTKHFALGKRVDLSPPPGWKENTPFNENDPVYLQHYSEVKEKGRKSPSSRNVNETVTGIYWAYDGVEEIGTPPRFYNQICVEILNKRLADLEFIPRLIANARLLTLVNVALADAAIEAWHYKFVFDLWRPVNAIRERGKGLGPDTKTPSAVTMDPEADPFWEPLGAPSSNSFGRDFTPPFPAYPSGHATFGAAAFEMIRLYFGVSHDQIDSIAFDFVSDEMNGLTKDSRGNVRPRRSHRFESLIDAMYANAVSRVYLGVHWRFDGTMAMSADEILTDMSGIGGIPLGRRVATEVFSNLQQSSKSASDFSVFMNNELQFSDCSAPGVPTTPVTKERLKVELNGQYLTIREAQDPDNLGNVIYAVKTLDVNSALTFGILSMLPPGVEESKFFPGNGTVSVHTEQGKLRLQAAGTDNTSGMCRGWIFNAVEV